MLFHLFSKFYEPSSVITTNLSVGKWSCVFGDASITTALLDRLTHRCHIIEMNGESYRLKDARGRQRSKRRKARKQPPGKTEASGAEALTSAENKGK